VYVSYAPVSFTAHGTTHTLKVPGLVITFSSTITTATTEYVQLNPTSLGKG